MCARKIKILFQYIYIITIITKSEQYLTKLPQLTKFNIVNEDIFQRYKILERVRQDKTFDKFIAYDSIKKELVFLKICNIPYGKSTRLGEELLRNFKIYSKIIHPNLFKIFDFGYGEDKFYVALEYLKGDYLDRVMHRENIDISASLKIVVSIAQGLKALEENYLFHGNLHATSIFIGEQGEVKIDDVGTNRLMFPLVETLNISDDIYNVGNVLQELITYTYSTKKDKIIHCKEMENILHKIKHRDTKERYLSVSKLLDDLILCAEEITEPAPTFGKDAKSSVSTKHEYKKDRSALSYRKRHHNRSSVLPTAIVIIILLLLGWYFYSLFSQPVSEIPDIRGLKLSDAREVLKKGKLKLHINRNRYESSAEPDTILEQRPYPSKMVRGGRVVYVVVNVPPQKITVPLVSMKQEREAIALLENSGLKIGKVTTAASKDLKKGVVIGQYPPAFSLLSPGNLVNLQISSGPIYATVEVPDLRGLTLEEGKIKMEQIGLKLGYVKKVVSEDIPEGQIIAQTPRPHARVKAGDIVNLDISALLPEKEVITPKKEKEERSAEITITVPPSPTSSELQPVKVVVIDGEGMRDIYHKSHAPGDKIKLNIKGAGKTTVQIYIADELKQEKSF